MLTRSALASCVLAAALAAQEASSEAAAQIDPTHAALDAWLDARWEDAPLPDALEGLDCAELEALLRAGRASYPEPGVEPGEVALREIACEHVDYETEYLIYVSTKRDPGAPTSLLLIGHGGNSNMPRDYAHRTAQGGLGVWIEQVERRGWIAVAPLTRRGWGPIGNSILLSILSELQREYPIDPDRVYVTGHSMGGHLSWRSGISMPDRWAAISPMSGGYDFVESGQVKPLFNVPGYATWGAREPYDINPFNRSIRDWMDEHEYDWVNVEKPGGHEIFLDELPLVGAFFDERSRDLYRDAVFARGGGTLRFEATWGIEGWDQEHTWNAERPIPHSTFHWIRLVPREGDEEERKTQQEVWAVNAGDNVLELTTSGVRELRVLLHPEMVDFDEPVEIRVNGRRAFRERVDPDPELLLELVREFDDRGRVFHAAVDLRVRDDGDVPDPHGGER